MQSKKQPKSPNLKALWLFYYFLTVKDGNIAETAVEVNILKIFQSVLVTGICVQLKYSVCCKSIHYT